MPHWGNGRILTGTYSAILGEEKYIDIFFFFLIKCFYVTLVKHEYKLTVWIKKNENVSKKKCQ